CQHYNTLPWTF
nr:immunoglobulin light chain junction region [Macaca mulatta]